MITSLHHPGWIGGRHRHYDRIFRAADAVIALTEHEKRVLVEHKGVRGSAVHVTGIGPVLADDADVPGLRARHRLDRRYVLFLGRKVAHKGWQALLAAAPRVFERCTDVDFVFVGSDDARSRAAFAAARDPRIRNLGLLDLRDKTAALAGCELLCLPSTQESFGGVLTEAWALGKPVIGGRIPATAEIVEEGVDGLLSSQAPDELADRILHLLLRPDEARRIGEAGRRKVETRYGWRQLAATTEAIYRAALGDPPGASAGSHRRPRSSSMQRSRRSTDAERR